MNFMDIIGAILVGGLAGLAIDYKLKKKKEKLEDKYKDSKK